MKSPYRKGIQVTVSNAAVQAAAILVSNYYRGANPAAVKAIINLAAQLIDEIEMRQTEQPVARELDEGFTPSVHWAAPEAT